MGLVTNWRSGYAQRASYGLFDTSLPARYRSAQGTDPSPPAPGAVGQPDRNNVQRWAEFRIPDLFTVNLLVGYDFYELTKQHLVINAGIENLFDNVTPTTLQTSTNQAPPSTFGTATARPTPLRVQLGMRYSY